MMSKPETTNGLTFERGALFLSSAAMLIGGACMASFFLEPSVYASEGLGRSDDPRRAPKPEPNKDDMTQDDINKIANSLKTSNDPQAIAAFAREQGWHDAAFFLRHKGYANRAAELESAQDARSEQGNKAAALYTKLRGGAS